jgi:hypothetical protein
LGESTGLGKVLNLSKFLNLDPDPDFYSNADTDPASKNNADPVPNPGFCIPIDGCACLLLKHAFSYFLRLQFSAGRRWRYGASHQTHSEEQVCDPQHLRVTSLPKTP